ncbi:MAG: hypothetical protein ACO29H_04215 [Opitutales bacterium]|jgi:hypothetical protein
MRLLSCLALVISSTLLPAQDFDFKGVPADYAVTFATASTRGLKISDSSEAKAFKERLEKLVAEFDKSGQDGKAVQAAIKNATGFDLESGDNRFTGGFSVTQAGAFNGGLIIRGRHDSAKLAAHAAGKNVPSLRAGATKGWKAQELIASLSEDLAQAANNFPTPPQGEAPGSEDVGVFDIDNDTLVVAQPKEAARIIGLLKGQGASFALPATQRSAAAATGRPYAVISVNAAKLPATPELTESGFVGGLFAMGEKGNDQIMKVNTTFITKEKAAPLAMQAQGMLAMAPMMLAGDPTKPETAEEKEMKALAGEFLAGIQPVEASGNQVTLTAKWDTLKLFGMIEKIVAIGAAKAKEMPQPALGK